MSEPVLTFTAAELAEHNDRVRADAVAAERHAMGVWLRNPKNWGQQNIASAIEHGDHIEQDESITADPAPPLPSLRLTLAANRMLLEKVAALEAERDRRIEPVEHARAAMDAWLACFVSQASAEYEEHGTGEAILWRQAAMGWAQSEERATLLARVGADVLAEVER